MPILCERAMMSSPESQPKQREYRQILLADDEIQALSQGHLLDGWKIVWPGIPATILANFEMDPDLLADRLGISFEQRIDYGDGLGDRPRAILDLPSGLRIGFSLYPTRNHMPHWHSIDLDVDSFSIRRPFVDGFRFEYIVERYRDVLIDEVATSLDLPIDLFTWRVQPLFDPPVSTPEGMMYLEALRSNCPSPRFEPGAIVRVTGAKGRLARHEGAIGTVVDRLLYTAPESQHSPWSLRDWKQMSHAWKHSVVIREHGRLWQFWESDLVGTGALDPDLAELLPR